MASNLQGREGEEAQTQASIIHWSLHWGILQFSTPFDLLLRVFQWRGEGAAHCFPPEGAGTARTGL